MGFSKYEMLIEDVPVDNWNLIPYFENQPNKVHYDIKPFTGPPKGRCHQKPSRSSPQTIVIIPSEASEEPDFMGLSFSVTLFCCFILGSIAFLFSKKTRRANLIGDRKAARRNSKIAFIMSMISLVVGVVMWIVYYAFRMNNLAISQPSNKP